MGQRRVRRRRGDGPHARLLVEPRRLGARRRPGSTPARSSAGTSATRPTRRRAPTEMPYPAAGTPNADVTLHVIGLDGSIVDVEWDRAAYPYLDRRAVDRRRPDRHRADARPAHGRRCCASTRRPAPPRCSTRTTTTSGSSSSTASRACSPDGTLVTCADRDGARRLLVGGEPVTPADLQVRAVVDGRRRRPSCSRPTPSTTRRRCRSGGARPTATLTALTDEPGVHTAAAGGGTVVVRTTTLAEPGAQWETLDGVELANHAATPGIARRRVDISFAGPSRIATAVLLPRDHDGSPLPVLLDPYGGPHGPRVVQAHNAHLASQWFADQGFAVVVADGRGTPGRGSAWERAVHHDLATPVLDDQITALHHAAEQHPALDLSRVAIRGWSFGGYLAALAVLRRPDVFHAAIAGAPVTEWRLYDTHYTERYLGDPERAARRLRRQLAAAARRRPDPPAAARPRPGRRQRRRRPHAAAVVGAARRRPTARGAAARRHDAHGRRRGRRRAPAAAPARLPAPFAGRSRRPDYGAT